MTATNQTQVLEEFNEETVAAMEEARAIAKGDIYAKRYNSFSEAMKELKD